MAAKTEWLSVRWRPRGLRPNNASAALINAIPVDQAPSWQLMCFASIFSLAGLLLGVVCLIGCKDLASSGLASAGKSSTTATQSADSPRIITVKFPAVSAQGQIAPAANVFPFAPATPAPALASPKPVSAAPLRITKAILPVGIAQSDYDTALVARGGVPPYSWDTTAGQIAPGLTLRSSAGTISGIPFVPGAFSFRVRVRDSAGSSLSTTVSLNVLGAPPTTGSDVVADATPVDGGAVMMISDRLRVQPREEGAARHGFMSELKFRPPKHLVPRAIFAASTRRHPRLEATSLGGIDFVAQDLLLQRLDQVHAPHQVLEARVRTQRLENGMDVRH